MIVPTMNETEIKKEIVADFKNAIKKSEYFDNDFRRKVLKAKSYPTFSCYNYTSPLKNKWLILFEARSKKEFGKNSRVVFVSYAQTTEGIYAFQFAYNCVSPHILVYTPHFFKRYNQRCNINKTGCELIKQYFTYNHAYKYAYRTHIKDANNYKNEVYGSTKDGVALGWHTTGGNVHFKTFITYEMTKGDQIEIFAQNEKIRQELHG